MKRRKKNSIEYDYIVHNISEDNIQAYKAVVSALGCIVYGDNLAELEAGLKLAIEAEIKDRTKKHQPAPAPDIETQYSGKFVARIGSDLHEKLALEAKARGKSLNSYVKEKCRTEVIMSYLREVKMSYLR